MTEAKSANWNSDGANAARKIEDLFPAYVWPETAGDAAEEAFEAGAREAFLPIFATWDICQNSDKRVARGNENAFALLR